MPSADLRERGLTCDDAPLVRIMTRGSVVRLTSAESGLHRLTGHPRTPTYDARTVAALTKCWAVLNAPAGKRLAPMLAELVPLLRRHGELDLDDAELACAWTPGTQPDQQGAAASAAPCWRWLEPVGVPGRAVGRRGQWFGPAGCGSMLLGQVQAYPTTASSSKTSTALPSR